MADLIKLGALWIKKDKNGRSYLTGRYSAATRLMIFKNEYKTAENQPDYVMYLAPIEQAEGGQTRQSDDFLEDSGISPAPVRSAGSNGNGASARRDTLTDDMDDESETRRPQPARPNAGATPASRPPARPAQSPPARTTRNAPAPPDDFDEDLDDPFAN